MTKNLVAKNGTVVHAPSTTDRNPVLCSNMRRDHRTSYEIAEATFSVTDAPVTCKDCCRILGIEAPKTLAGQKAARPALDTFEVGGRIIVSTIGGTVYGTITKLTKTMVTFLSDDAPAGKDGRALAMAMPRTKARSLNS
jgi:hypothetical protein